MLALVAESQRSFSERMFNQHNVFLQAIARMHENVNEDWECCFTVQISNFIFQKVFLERKMMFVLFTFFVVDFLPKTERTVDITK